MDFVRVYDWLEELWRTLASFVVVCEPLLRRCRCVLGVMIIANVASLHILIVRLPVDAAAVHRRRVSGLRLWCFRTDVEDDAVCGLARAPIERSDDDWGHVVAVAVRMASRQVKQHAVLLLPVNELYIRLFEGKLEHVGIRGSFAHAFQIGGRCVVL